MGDVVSSKNVYPFFRSFNKIVHKCEILLSQIYSYFVDDGRGAGVEVAGALAFLGVKRVVESPVHTEVARWLLVKFADLHWSSRRSSRQDL